MTTHVVIIGGVEHTRVVAEAVRSDARFELRGFVDPKPSEETLRRSGLQLLGDDAVLHDYPGSFCVLGVGPKPGWRGREAIITRLSSVVAGWATVVHTRATVSPSAELGEGCVIMAGAVIQAGARIGRHAVVNTGAVIEPDVDVEDFAHVAPGVVLGGGAKVGYGAYLGLGATVRDHIRVGSHAVVAMGSVVGSNVPEHVQVRGVPAREYAGDQ